MRDNIASGQCYLPTLVVDANGTAATQLANQLRRSGFSADVATNWPTAHAAARSRHYGSLVVVADPSLPVDLECLARLRGTAPRTWIIVVSSTTQHTVPQEILHCGADSLLTAPFSMEELTSRLLAFSRRSRLR